MYDIGFIAPTCFHRPSCIQYHEQMLRVTTKGEYAVSAIVRGAPVLPLPPLSLHDLPKTCKY
jgi:putative component of membrane protein insertase Oxa1/YidC/SpoIIIJ protein YidD